MQIFFIFISESGHPSLPLHVLCTLAKIRKGTGEAETGKNLS